MQELSGGWEKFETLTRGFARSESASWFSKTRLSQDKVQAIPLGGASISSTHGFSNPSHGASISSMRNGDMQVHQLIVCANMQAVLEVQSSRVYSEDFAGMPCCRIARVVLCTSWPRSPRILSAGFRGVILMCCAGAIRRVGKVRDVDARICSF